MKKLFREHKLLSGAIIIELFILIMLIGMLFAPMTGSAIGGINLSGRTEIGGLGAGKYKVTASYEVPMYADPSHANVLGLVKIGKQEGEGNGLLSADLPLRADATEQTTYIWVKPGYGRNSTFYVDYKTDDISNQSDDGWIDVPEAAFAATLTEVTIEEVYSYRFVRILLWILISLIVDAVIAFFADVIFKSSCEQKYVAMALLISTAFASALCFSNFIYVNPGHDLQIHLQRIVSVADAIKTWQIPHRMAEGLNNGYGYASPLFYPELFLLIPGVLCAIGLPLQTAYLAYIVMVNVATAGVGYYSFYKMSGSRRWGCFAAVLLELSAFRLTDIYQRQSLGEYTAFIFLPLVAYGFYRLYVGERSEKYEFVDALPLIIGCSMVAESHILSCYLIAAFGILFMLINAKKTFVWSRFKWLLISGVAIVVINLGYLVPMISSMRSIDGYYGYYYNLIGKSGVYPIQLLNIFRTAGGINIANGTVGEMPLTIGVTLMIGLLMTSVCYISRDKWKLEGKTEYRMANASFGYACLALILSSYIFPWDAIEGLNWRLTKLLGIVQFPWRYLTMATVFAVLAVMWILSLLEKNGYKKAAITAAAVLVALNVLTEGYTATRFADEAEVLVALTEQDIDYQMDMLYLPLGASVDDSNYAVPVQNGDGYDMPKYYYPNYHAYDINTGAELAVRRTDGGKLHVVADVSADNIEIVYKEPVLWKVCSILSLVSVCALIFYMVLKKWKAADR